MKSTKPENLFLKILESDRLLCRSKDMLKINVSDKIKPGKGLTFEIVLFSRCFFSAFMNTLKNIKLSLIKHSKSDKYKRPFYFNWLHI